MYQLPWKDSNPHRRNQNPTCYHYTTRHYRCLRLQSYRFFSFCATFSAKKFRKICIGCNTLQFYALKFSLCRIFLYLCTYL